MYSKCLKYTPKVILGCVGICTGTIGYQIGSTKYMIQQLENEHNSKLIMVTNRNDKKKHGLMRYINNKCMSFIFDSNMIDIDDDEKFKKILEKNTLKRIKKAIKY